MEMAFSGGVHLGMLVLVRYLDYVMGNRNGHLKIKRNAALIEAQIEFLLGCYLFEIELELEQSTLTSRLLCTVYLSRCRLGSNAFLEVAQ